MARAPWKFDVTLLDLAGYSSNGATVHLAENDRLVVKISSSSDTGLQDDFFVEELLATELQSTDGGISWEECEGQMPPEGCRVGDGTWVRIGAEVLRDEALREHLEREGLGHLYKPGGWMGYRLYRAEKRAELEALGWQVDDAFEGIVAHYPGIVAWTSTDDGETWTSRPIEKAPRGAHIVGWNVGTPVVLANGTILGAIYGRVNREDPSSRVWASRSTDGGQTWDFITVFHDPTGDASFNEADLVLMPSGRILAMARPQVTAKHNMFQSYSDDGGLSWSAPEQVPFWGFPPNLLLLDSGAVMVTYAHRRHPCGVRACISYDEGRTWDVENEIIVRDDSLPKGVGYPKSVQLSDGSIFTVCAQTKIAGLKPEDQVKYGKTLILHPWFHTYIAASRYSPDYVRARGQKKIYPTGVFPRRTTPTTGTDATTDSPQR